VAAPKTTVWDLEPHTRAKHEILRRYLDAWLPILSRGQFPTMLYIDGFAGPGVYSNGEDGSPIIAIKRALAVGIPATTELHFFFVEKDPERAQSLQQLVEAIALPKNFHVTVAGGVTFEEGFGQVLKQFNGKLPATFAFIDPFGWAVPFEIVKTIMARPSCEVLINFMYEEINRFIGKPDQEANFDRFFGTKAWRECGAIQGDPKARDRCLHDLYMRQLKEGARAKFVRSFQMRNDRDGIDYYLFYATNNEIGLSVMKDAMWKVDKTGEFRFSDATNFDQMILFEPEPPPDKLRAQMWRYFSEQEVNVGNVIAWVVQETAFRAAHVRAALKSLETASPPAVNPVNPPADRKRGTYPERYLGMRLRFTRWPGAT